MSYDEKLKDGNGGKPDDLSITNGIHNFEEIKRIIDALSKDEKEATSMKTIYNDLHNIHSEEDNAIINDKISVSNYFKDEKENLEKNEDKIHSINKKSNEENINSNTIHIKSNGKNIEDEGSSFLKMMILNYFKSNEWKELLKINLQEVLLKYFKENQVEIFRNCLTGDFLSNLKQELSHSILNSEYTINYTQNLLEKTLCGEILYKLAERQIKEIMLKKLSG